MKSNSYVQRNSCYIPMIVSSLIRVVWCRPENSVIENDDVAHPLCCEAVCGKYDLVKQDPP